MTAARTGRSPRRAPASSPSTRRWHDAPSSRSAARRRACPRARPVALCRRHQGQGRFQFAGVLLQALAVEGVTPHQMLAQGAGCPLTEASPLDGFHPVSDRNDDIKAIEPHRLVRSGNVQILHIAFLSQFPLREHIPQVLPASAGRKQSASARIPRSKANRACPQ